jgi:GT2 family glycosyltransferase
MQNPNLIKPKYSVIVLIYHRTPELVQMARNCIASVKNSSQDYELIIVDNGSTQRYPWENECDTYIRFNENKGISRGWNEGLRIARGRYLVILGDDVIVHKGYLEALEVCFEKPNCGVSNVYVQHLPQGMGIVEDYKWFSGACFMLKQKTIEKVGYFNEEIFPCNTEDWDYWIRVYQNGLKLYKNFTFSIQHLEGQTVHAPDLSIHTQTLLKKLEEKIGMNPVDIFCGEAKMPFG